MNAKDTPLDTLTAYRAMLRFLEMYWERGKSKEIAMLLGSMALASDGKTMDPAMWKDWLEATRHVSGSSSDSPKSGGN